MASILGSNLRRLRAAKRPEMTQAELASLSGVSRGTIAEIERGARTNVETETLQRLADALDLSVGDLFDQQPPAPRGA